MHVKGKLLHERVNLIYSNALAANLMVILVAGLFGYFVHADSQLRLFVSVWAFAMVILAVIRLQLYRVWKTDPELYLDQKWLNRYTFLTAIIGLGWAAPAFIVLWNDDLYNIVLVYIVLSGLQMMAVPVLAAVKPIFYAYIIPSALVLILLSLFVEYVPGYMGAASFVWGLVVLVMADNLYRRMTWVFSLEFENRALEKEISKRKRVEDDLSYLAHHDALTDLPNRLLLDIRLQHAIENARRYKKRKLAVLFIDLDNFKKVNDSLGHAVGDLLLQQIAVRLKDAVRDGDTVARLGGDEFIVVVERMENTDAVHSFVQKMIVLMDVPFDVKGNKLHISFSVGVSVFPDHGESSGELIKNSDTAMYRVKELGRNDYCFYTRDLTERTLQHIAMENDLRTALDDGQIEVYYQVQIDLVAGGVSGVEALVRWHHPELGLLLPGKCLSIAEESGLIASLGEEVLYQACEQMVSWKRQGLDVGRVAVNLAGAQLRASELFSIIEKIFRATDCDPKWVEFELLEDFIMHESANLIAMLQCFKDEGVVLAIDDFGTGYSSLSRLKQLPINKLKIDRSFIRDIEHDPDDATIVKAIIAMGKSLNLNILAEGVENQAQVDFLLAEGCDNAQGFYFSRPVPASQVESVVNGLRGI